MGDTPAHAHAGEGADNDTDDDGGVRDSHGDWCGNRSVSNWERICVASSSGRSSFSLYLSSEICVRDKASGMGEVQPGTVFRIG